MINLDANWHPWFSYGWWADIGANLIGIVAALIIGGATIVVAAQSNRLARESKSFTERVRAADEARASAETERGDRDRRTVFAQAVRDLAERRADEARFQYRDPRTTSEIETNQWEESRTASNTAFDRIYQHEVSYTPNPALARWLVTTVFDKFITLRVDRPRTDVWLHERHRGEIWSDASRVNLYWMVVEQRVDDALDAYVDGKSKDEVEQVLADPTLLEANMEDLSPEPDGILIPFGCRHSWVSASTEDSGSGADVCARCGANRGIPRH